MINIDGTEYYTKNELVAKGLAESEHVIVICKQGWIFEGWMSEPYKLTDAHVVRKWNNGMGIGGLQTKEHQHEYTLDALPCGISITEQAVLAVLPITEW